MSVDYLRVNNWLIHAETGDVWQYSESVIHTIQQSSIERIDPQSTKLLRLLEAHINQIVPKRQIVEHLWENSIVTDDALARCVSRLRKALNDDPKQPKIIETLPKRGYRLIAEHVEWLNDNAPLLPQAKQVTSTVVSNFISLDKLIGAALILGLLVVLFMLGFTTSPSTDSKAADDVLIGKADDYYIQMRRQDNEMAIELYQQAIALKPDSGKGLAGLANALVQQVIRWPNPPSQDELPVRNLGQALDEGRHLTPQAQQKLERALALAQKSVALSPSDARSHKALGFVYSAQQQFDQAIASYTTAVQLDPNAWDALINLGDVYDINNEKKLAISYFELAFEAMGRVYEQQTARVRPWYADLGAIIGDRYRHLYQPDSAEVWYRRVLGIAPFNAIATNGLATLLLTSGDQDGATRLCDEYIQRIGTNPCSELLNLN